jgi:hypothetical protein
LQGLGLGIQDGAGAWAQSTAQEIEQTPSGPSEDSALDAWKRKVCTTVSPQLVAQRQARENAYLSAGSTKSDKERLAVSDTEADPQALAPPSVSFKDFASMLKLEDTGTFLGTAKPLVSFSAPNTPLINCMRQTESFQSMTTMSSAVTWASLRAPPPTPCVVERADDEQADEEHLADLFDIAIRKLEDRGKAFAEAREEVKTLRMESYYTSNSRRPSYGRSKQVVEEVVA